MIKEFLNMHNERRTVNVLFLIGVLLYVSQIFLFQHLVADLRRSRDWVDHSYQVIEINTNLMFNLILAESNHRGFILTQDQNYMQMYHQSLGKVNELLPRLEKSVLDNPEQETRVKELAQLIPERAKVMESVLGTAKNRNFASATEIIKLGEGRKMSLKIIDLSQQISNEETKLLKQRNELESTAFTNAISCLLISGFIDIVFVLICFAILNRFFRLRIVAEKQALESAKKAKITQSKLSRHVKYDSLTGLQNRIFFQESIASEFALANKFKYLIAVIMMDIDNFKSVNDSLGHRSGDKLLQLFSRRLRETLRQEDKISRLGGDEFAIVVSPVKSKNDIILVAKKIMDGINKPFEIDGHSLHTTVSMGIAIYPQNGVDSASMLKNADIALYKAKSLGRNNFQFCTEDMIHAAQSDSQIIENLHSALKRNEFVLYFQPKMSPYMTPNGPAVKMNKLEALLRWRLDNGEMISPDKFIKLAEKDGIITPISEWVLAAACKQGKLWHDMGKDFDIAINISPQLFNNPNFVDVTKKIIHDSGINPQKLEFEITENVLFENSEHNIAILKEFKQMGIIITLDDFGTGYSSLDYLRKIIVDKIKIDQRFVHEITPTHPTSAIVKAMINLAHNLNITVVAEGVETKFQVDFLIKEGCDELQGFYFGRPMPADKIADFKAAPI